MRRKKKHGQMKRIEESENGIKMWNCECWMNVLNTVKIKNKKKQQPKLQFIRQNHTHIFLSNNKTKLSAYNAYLRLKYCEWRSLRKRMLKLCIFISLWLWPLLWLQCINCIYAIAFAMEAAWAVLLSFMLVH